MLAGIPETPDIYAHYHGGGEESQPYLAGLAPVFGKRVSFFNSVDYALSSPIWAFNNAMKPDDKSFAFFNYEDGDGNLGTYKETQTVTVDGEEKEVPCDQFFRDPPLADREVQKIGDANLPDRFRIFAYCAESRNKAMGRIQQSIEDFSSFNLQGEELNYDHRHYCHSREFRSNIVDEWAYWKKVMEVAEYTQDMWPAPE